MILHLAPSETTPSNDNNIIDVCIACETFAACREGLCPKCDHDVMAHFDEVEHFAFDPNDAGAAPFNPGKY